MAAGALPGYRSCLAVALAASPTRLLYPLLFQEIDGVLDGNDFLGGFVRYLEFTLRRAERLLQGHDQFHQVERIGAEVFNKAGRGDDVLNFDAELLHDYRFNLIENSCHFSPPFMKLCRGLP